MLANVEKTVNDVTEWIKDYFETKGKGCKAVLGISGGKDSFITAALLARALGKERVIGVLMPNPTEFSLISAIRKLSWNSWESTIWL